MTDFSSIISENKRFQN